MMVRYKKPKRIIKSKPLKFDDVYTNTMKHGYKSLSYDNIINLESFVCCTLRHGWIERKSRFYESKTTAHMGYVRFNGVLIRWNHKEKHWLVGNCIPVSKLEVNTYVEFPSEFIQIN